MKKIFFLFFCPLLVYSQSFTNSYNNIEECGTIATQSQIDYLTQTSNARKNWNGPEMLVYLPIQHHIVRESDGTGGLDSTNIPIMMSIMNSYYSNANIAFYNCGNINFIIKLFHFLKSIQLG